MAHALFFGLPLHGHTNPSLPLVRELVDRGDTVTYFSTEAFASQVRDTGAVFRPYRNAFLADLSTLPNRVDELSWLLMRTASEVLATHLDECRAAGPDYVIADSVAPWGQWVAACLSRPLVTSTSTFAFNRHVLAWAARQGARPKSPGLVLAKLKSMSKAAWLRRTLCHRYGVNGPGVIASVLGHSDLNVVYTSTMLQPCADTFDARYLFVGPSMADRADTADVTWLRNLQEPVVYISLGTLFNQDPDFYRLCLRTFANEDVRVVLSIGTTTALDALGPIPPNMVVRPVIPQLAVLARAAVFVTHGGMNSVNESLSRGVPIVALPRMSEQEAVARRVAALGAGLCLDRITLATDTLRDAVRRVQDEPGFRDRAAAIGASLRSAGGVRRAAEAIQAFVRVQSSASRGPS
jgi:MGT family glycosyltransferase